MGWCDAVRSKVELLLPTEVDYFRVTAHTKIFYSSYTTTIMICLQLHIMLQNFGETKAKAYTTKCKLLCTEDVGKPTFTALPLTVRKR